MRLPQLLYVVFLMLISTGFAQTGFAANERGKVLGTKMISYPDWFKDSFLEIAEDVEEATIEGKHVLLFMDMNGCPYCYKMVEENFRNSPYKSFIQEHFDVIPLNVKGDREVALNEEVIATEKEIAKQLNVRFTPGLVFLNSDNQAVVKLSGYRNVRDFRVILDYVQQKAYKDQKLAEFVRMRKEEQAYSLRDHPQFSDVSDLSSVKNGPLALIFEDSGCLDCAALHEGHLAAEEVRDALEDFTVVRIDAFSDSPINDLEGRETTQRGLSESMNVSYTPAIVLIDKGKEMLRIENMLYRFHFTALLEYVGGRHYKKYPNSPFQYVGAKTEKLLEEGVNVSLSDE